ncbi:MAG: hypothetical protein ACLTSZ_14860 [Lachnospiraceae bacterium]
MGSAQLRTQQPVCDCSGGTAGIKGQRSGSRWRDGQPCFLPLQRNTRTWNFRKELIAKGEIQYPVGKIQMFADGVLKDVDVCLHMHAMGESKYHFAVDSSLAGLFIKKFIFHGRKQHMRRYSRISGYRLGMHLHCSRVQRGCSGRPLWTRIRIVFMAS